MRIVEAKIDSIFEKYLARKYFAGGVCHIQQNGKLIFSKAYGKRNTMLDEKMKADSIFDLASLTKIITSTLILRLISKRQLALDTTLKECLPAIAEDQEKLASLTIRQLLTHSTGLIAWHPLYADISSTGNFIDAIKEINLFHQESNKVLYSDLNYILLGEVLKEHYHSDLQDILQIELSSPLQLARLTYGPLIDSNIAATEFGNRIEMEMCRQRGKTFSGWRSIEQPISGDVNDGNAFYFFKGQSGHAGLFGTAEDLSVIIEEYLQAIAGDSLILDSGLAKESVQNQVADRGLGWHSGKPFPIGVGHTGFTGTSLWIVPEKD